MIIKLEEMCMNAWPALKSMQYDGWIIRFAKGYSRRSNSVNAVYAGQEDVDSKIQEVERIFASQGQKSIFKITPEVFPGNLDSILESKGYALEALTSVQTMEIGELEDRLGDVLARETVQDEAVSGESDAASSEVYAVTFEQELSETWIHSYCKLNNVPSEHWKTVSEILGRIVPKRYFVTLKRGGSAVACGLGVMEQQYVGLFDIVVHKDLRGKGLGEKLLLNILRKAKDEGASTAYLQVMCNNPAALRLYEKLGFKEVYKYWYRTKEVY